MEWVIPAAPVAFAGNEVACYITTKLPGRAVQKVRWKYGEGVEPRGPVGKGWRRVMGVDVLVRPA